MILVLRTRGQDNHTIRYRRQGTAEIKTAVCIGHSSECAVGTADMDKVDDSKHSTERHEYGAEGVETNSELPDQRIGLTRRQRFS